MSNLDYAPCAEAMGRLGIASERFNGSASDTGDMEALHRYGSLAQTDRWLRPLRAGEIRSAFLMTEPEVASPDATNIATSIRWDGDHYVIDGRKWWSTRVAFGKRFSERSVREERVARARIDIEMTRLLCLKAADMMDRVGAKGAKLEIAMIEAAAPRVALQVIDDAIQAHGGAGVEDFGLARLYAHVRTLRLADGPDQVHNRSIARLEFSRHDSARDAGARRENRERRGRIRLDG